MDESKELTSGLHPFTSDEEIRPEYQIDEPVDLRPDLSTLGIEEAERETAAFFS